MKSSANPVKSLRFPKYLYYSLGRESSGAEFKNPEQRSFFENLFGLDQVEDQLEAYTYAEQRILPLGLESLTPEKLEQFIKKINQIAARSLVRCTTSTVDAGAYTTQGISILQETSRADLTFKNDANYSEHNYNTLKILYGEKTANLYLQFFIVMKEKLNGLAEQKNHFKEYITQFGMDNSEEFKAYSLVMHLPCYRSEVPEKMKLFCQEVIHQIHANKPPVEIAAYILRELCQVIHPFPGRNKGTSRILINTLFMMMGCEPLHTTKEQAPALNYAIQHAIRQNDLSPVISLLSEYLKIPRPRFAAFPHLTREFYEKRYNGITQQNTGEDVFSVAYPDRLHWLQDARAISAYEKFCTQVSISTITPNPKTDEKAKIASEMLIKKIIDGDACVKYAKDFTKDYPNQAYYLYMRAADFYEASKRMDKAKQARGFAETIHPSPETPMPAENPGERVTVTYTPSNQARPYLESLSETVDDNLRFNEKKLSLSIFWLEQAATLAKMKEDKEVPAIKELSRNLNLQTEAVEVLVKASGFTM